MSNNVDSVSEHKNNISKILVPIDGSKFSIKAADYAMLLSSKLDADLFVIHVLDDIPYEHNVGAFGLYDIETPDEIKQILQEARDAKREWIDDIKTRAKEKNVRMIRTDLVTTRSSIESAIVNYGERNQIELIIIGTSGHSGFKKLMPGGVALGVMKHSHCPVMMIK